MKYLKAAVFYGPKQLKLEERPIPSPKDREIVIKVDTSGLCPTDVKIYKYGSSSVKPPVILGHEFSGTVYSIGNKIEEFKEGDRVNVAADSYCGTCDMCKIGKENLCRDPLSFGYNVDGAHADYVLIPQRFVDKKGVFKAPDNVSLEITTLNEPLACVYHSLNQMGIAPDKKILIIGDGPMGLMHVFIAKLFGYTSITLAGLIDWKLKLGENLGATEVINSEKNRNLIEEAKKIAPEGFDQIVLSVVTSDLIKESLKIANKGGYVSIFAGVPSGSVTTNFDPNLIHYNEVSLIGSSGYTYSEYRKAFDIVVSHEYELSQLITHRFKLEEIKNAISEWEDKERSLKIMIKR